MTIYPKSNLFNNLIYLIYAGEYEYINEALKTLDSWRINLYLFTAKDVLTRFNPRILVDKLIEIGEEDKAYDTHLKVKNRSALDIFGAKVIDEKVMKVIGESAKVVEDNINAVRSGRCRLREATFSIKEAIKPVVVESYLDFKGDEDVIDFHFGEKTGYFHRKQFKEIRFEDLRDFVEGLLKNEEVKSALLELYGRSGIKGNQIIVDGNWVYIIYENGKYWWAKLKKQDDLLRLLNDILLACLTHQSHLAYKGISTKKKDKQWLSTISAKIKQSKSYQRIVKDILKESGKVFGDLFNYDEVIIAPAYPLVNFPYHLIMNSDGKMLIETTKVKYVPHAGVAERLRNKKGMKDKDVEKASIIYVNIPEAFTKEEAEIIKEIVPDSQLIDATNLTKDVVLNKIRKDATILHFACHAVAMPKAQYSYLGLSKDPDSRDPNLRIYLSDLLSLKLDNLSLVCLSACETGH